MMIAARNNVTSVCFFLIAVLFLIDPAMGAVPRMNCERILQTNVQDNKSAPPKDSWFGKDKLQHIFGSAFITGLGFLMFRELLNRSEKTALYSGSGVAFGIGVSKELYDRKTKKGRASYKDLVADLLGIGLTAFLLKVI